MSKEEEEDKSVLILDESNVKEGDDNYEEEDYELEDYLYGDLENTGKDADIIKMKDALRLEQDKNEKLQLECSELRKQLCVINDEKKQLEVNMMAIYNTAITELKRKDREINELREFNNNNNNNNNHVNKKR